MPDPARIARMNRLVDRRRTERLSRMDRDGHVRVRGDLERRLVVDRRMYSFGAREIECNDAAVAEVHRELRHLDRRLHRQIAQPAHDERRGDLVIGLRATQPPQGSLDHFRV